MKTVAEKQTIIKVTSLLESKDRFCFTTYTRSSILSAAGEVRGEKRPPKNFVRSVLSGLTNNNKNFIKAIPLELSGLAGTKIKDINDEIFYDANYLDYYINNNNEVYKIFMNRYFKHQNALVISFQNQSLISRNFGDNSSYIQIPYNDFYDKVDSVTAQVSEFSNAHDICILDCPMFSSAIAPKIWEKTNMSIMDLGKSLTLSRSFNKAK